MLPPAPVRFSTTKGWPRRSCSRLASVRPTRSGAPPGGNGTSTRTGLVGYACAHTEPAKTSSNRLQSRIRILSPQGHRAVRRSGDVEIEREMLARGLHVAQVALQRIASIDGIRAVERPERLHRLARLRNCEGVLRAQAQLRFDVQGIALLKNQGGFAHQVARRIDQAARPRELDLHRLEVGHLGAGIGADSLLESVPHM